MDYSLAVTLEGEVVDNTIFAHHNMNGKGCKIVIVKGVSIGKIATIQELALIQETGKIYSSPAQEVGNII